jgi:hypothetical protein
LYSSAASTDDEVNNRTNDEDREKERYRTTVGTARHSEHDPDAWIQVHFLPFLPATVVAL